MPQTHGLINHLNGLFYVKVFFLYKRKRLLRIADTLPDHIFNTIWFLIDTG